MLALAHYRLDGGERIVGQENFIEVTEEMRRRVPFVAEPFVFRRFADSCSVVDTAARQM